MTNKEKFEQATTLWEIVEVALDEVKSCQEQGIVINMGSWVKYETDIHTVCSVCLAGAVMVGLYPSKSVFTLIDEHEGMGYKYKALNFVRQGIMSSALVLMYGYHKQMPTLFRRVREEELIPLDRWDRESNEDQLELVKLVLPILKELDI